jgi:UDP-glucose 4-epimerase
VKVAVTGSSGGLGRFVVAELAREHDVVPIDRAPHPAHDTRVVDILDRDGVAAALSGCESAVHLAAIDQAREASEDDFFRTNVLGAWNVLAAAEVLGLRRAVVCSSVAALGLRPEAPPEALPIATDHPLRPVTAYGLSKQASEAIAAGFSRRGRLAVACLRPALITFPHLVPEFARAAAASDGDLEPPGLPPPPVPAAEPLPLTRAWVGPEDCARAFAAALRAETADAAPLFVTADDTLSSRPTAALFRETFGVEPPLARPDLYNAVPEATPFDLEPTRAALGWQPRDRWADVVGQAVAEYRRSEAHA